LVPQPEQEARKGIDKLLAHAGWRVCDPDKADVHRCTNVAGDMRLGASTIVRNFRDKLFTEIFPGREWVPKTLIFAKGEVETGEQLVNVRLTVRVCVGRRTLGFRAERDARAKKHVHAGSLGRMAA